MPEEQVSQVMRKQVKSLLGSGVLGLAWDTAEDKVGKAKQGSRFFKGSFSLQKKNLASVEAPYNGLLLSELVDEVYATL